MNIDSGNLFYTEVMRGIFQISDKSLNPTEIEKSLAPGNPTRNSYLIIGDDKALLFDLALEPSSLKEYAEALAGKPVQLVISHGHYDHIFNLNRYSDVWMHSGDIRLLREGMLEFPPVEPCPEIHCLNDGDTIDLGQRMLGVFHIPGHTDGSILLLDRQTRTLLSGDTCARRLLYLTKDIPLKNFCDSLRRLQEQNFDVMFSAHDRCALPKAYIEHMINLIENELPFTTKTWEAPVLGTMAQFDSGDVYTLSYFSAGFPTCAEMSERLYNSSL